jgi:hypothetical protein
MRITKEEASILAACLERAKYDLPYAPGRGTMLSLDSLLTKLENGSIDTRRVNRGTSDSIFDVINRYHLSTSGPAVVAHHKKLYDADLNGE